MEKEKAKKPKAAPKAKPVKAPKTVEKPAENPVVIKPEAIEIPKPQPVVVATPIDAADEEPVVNIEKELAAKPDKYFEATGRRKTAVARVRLFTRGEKAFLVNGKPYKEYFTVANDQEMVVASLKEMNCLDKFRVTVIVSGGGHTAQAEAVRHGTARVLVDFHANFKKKLRKVGYLTRDPRMRERKKFGLKRARKSPQWAKR